MKSRLANGMIATWGALALTLAVITGCNKSTAEEQTAGPETAVVEKQDLNVRAEAAGLVEPITTVEIKSKASGEVLAVRVETGQEVARGTLLVEVEPRDVRNAMLQAQADLEVAQARSQTSAANRKRVDQLRKQNVATEQELETAVLEEANARAQLVKARTNLELARERMRDVTITAPLSGTVIEKTIEPGNIIASASGTFGGGTTLMKMADLSTVRVRALVDQTDIGKIQPGQQARVTVEAYPGRPFTGEVVKIEPQAVVDQNVTMFPVLIHLQNTERLLKPGMNTEVEIEIAERQDAIVVPNDAVVSMRDATTAGKALGLSEDDMRDRMQALRENMRAAPTGAPGTQVAQATGAAARQPQQQQQGELSPECTKLMAKARTDGRESLSDEERTRLRTCFGGRRQGGGSFGGDGNAAAQRRGNNRPGIVFVPGANGPEPRMVMLGVNDWDYTEVVSGLKEGDKVFLMTAARLAQQQRDRAEMMRQRTSGPMGGMRQQQQGGSQQGGGR
ncbi:MAG TPA: efflux RND transporter periplasmic adaptor subunit [Longimicrobiales bacterium]|nr:efflux RND transporter periplasmic adaptor subunit [Longimicrobiales bacterium]